ncbi:MAG: decaprenyl-phosphate phosphoribosyltransferase [Candidatus Nanoarchaeia archaeon]|nr:decaprenyl-phosphate phosphoribosyltransferase [Candidatus Nanoarchaeia archaeon]
MNYVLNLLRTRQYYKNLLIFLPLIFVGSFFNLDLWIKIFLGFIALCLISSANYILNDIVDIKKDQLHPEKRLRPLASGKISTKLALILAIILLTASLIISSLLSATFSYFVMVLFALTQLYTFYLKDQPFVDILIVSTNFVVRAISGIFIINSTLSPWLIACTFFLALFLVVGKREADSLLLKENSFGHKPVLKYYTKETNSALMIIATTLLITAYSLYSFLSQYPHLIYTIPFALYVIFRYFYLIENGSIIARHPEKLFKDFPITLGLLIWVALVFMIIY